MQRHDGDLHGSGVGWGHLLFTSQISEQKIYSEDPHLHCKIR